MNKLKNKNILNNYKALLFPAFILCIFMAGSTSLGNHISLVVKPTTRFSNNKVSVDFSVRNTGNAPAKNIIIEGRIKKTKVRSETHPWLEPGGKLVSSLDLGPAPEHPGLHTVILKVFYSDGNDHPFSALKACPVITGMIDPVKAESLITASMGDISITENGILRLKVGSSTNMTADISFLSPDEISLDPSNTRVKLEQGEKKNIWVDISNINAIEDSTYSILAVVSTDIDGKHWSVTSRSIVNINKHENALTTIQWLFVICGAILLAIFCLIQFYPSSPTLSAWQWYKSKKIILFAEKAFTLLILTAITVFILVQLHPELLTLDSTSTGGDTPAHNYLASHLKNTIFSEGRIVSWSHGWWCGFPVFQFYFSLPYLAVVALDLLLPFNIAFKLITIAGILALCPSTYAAARIARLPRITALVSAIAMLPILFDHTHTMWGVNIYSTLAGMISNSWSFCIMVIFIAMIYSDARENRFRTRTSLVYAALISSHFFTSVVGTIASAIVPFIFIRFFSRKKIAIVVGEGLLGAGLMAWWLLPLIAKREFAVDFGNNWEIMPLKHLPNTYLLIILAMFILAGIGLGLHRGFKFIYVILWMHIASIVLFVFGFEYVSRVFVNVRLWPFIIYSGTFMAAIGLSMFIYKHKAPELAVTSLMLFVMVFGIDRPNNVSNWAQWNYAGMEKKNYWHVFENLVLPLSGTPGRLANDLSDDNNLLGSSRIFESVPHLINKPVLEGGVVNSAFGSMFSYYIQSETSKSAAGFPPIVKPANFNITNATRHLELFNVKHFIARWSGTKKALDEHSGWKKLKSDSGWVLYESISNSGKYVFVPDRYPAAITTDESQNKARKKTALNWLYNIELIDQPFAILSQNENSDHFPVVLQQQIFESQLKTNIQALASSGEIIENNSEVSISEKIDTHNITFTTSATGLPHIIKCTYYPNWKVRGADKLYMVTPGFMLVYPEEKEVELSFGYTRSDNIGRFIALLCMVATICITVCKRKKYDD